MASRAAEEEEEEEELVLMHWTEQGPQPSAKPLCGDNKIRI